MFNGNYDGTSANANAQHDEEKKAEEERKKQEEEKKAEEERRLAEEKAAAEAAEAQRLAEEAARKHSPIHRFLTRSNASETLSSRATTKKEGNKKQRWL